MHAQTKNNYIQAAAKHAGTAEYVSPP